MTYPDVAKLVGCSLRTLKRHRAAAGITPRYDADGVAHFSKEEALRIKAARERAVLLGVRNSARKRSKGKAAK